MKQTQPVKPVKRRRKSPQQPVHKAEHLQPKEPPTEVKNLSVDDRRYLANQGEKYAPKPKVGTPTLGRSAGYVTKPGLGNLNVSTAYDHSDL